MRAARAPLFGGATRTCVADNEAKVVGLLGADDEHGGDLVPQHVVGILDDCSQPRERQRLRLQEGGAADEPVGIRERMEGRRSVSQEVKEWTAGDSEQSLPSLAERAEGERDWR